MIKKIIVIFIFILSLMTVYYVYNDTWSKQDLKVSTLENNIGFKFNIPDYLSLAESDEILYFINKASQKNKVNIIRAASKANAEEKMEYVKYILTNSDSYKDYFENFRLKKGRYLNKNDYGTEFYISTYENKNDKNQVGLLRNFAGKTNVTIKCFNKYCEFLPTCGEYRVDTNDKKKFDSFLTDLCEVIKDYYKTQFNDDIKYTPDDFLVKNNVGESYSFGFIKLLAFGLFVLIMILSFMYIYYVCSQTKYIGIMKLNGFSNVHVWWNIVGKFTVKYYLYSTLISLILSLFIRDITLEFIISILLLELCMLFFVLFSTIIGYLFIMPKKINSIIKNEDSSQLIFYVNILAKALIFILVFMSSARLYNKYEDLKLVLERKNNWAKSKDYGVFYPYTVPNDFYDFIHGSLKERYRIATKLYPTLNKMGSIFVNAHDYEELNFILNPHIEYKYRNMTVNNNYLKEFQVCDENGKAITVTEDTKDLIILIPANLKNDPEAVQKIVDDKFPLSPNSKNADIAAFDSKIANRKTKIIWTKNNQKIFSFNPDVFPTENNMIVDPVIKVITENNSGIDERCGTGGNGAGSPMKIRLINRDAELTYKTLLPYLKEYKLDDSYRHLVVIDQYIANEVNEIKTSMTIALMYMLLLIGLIFLLAVQNLSIYFNRNKQKLVVKKLFGVGFLKRYLNYILLMIFNAFGSIIIFIFVNDYLNKHYRYILDIVNINTQIFFMILFLSLAELLIFIPVACLIENKKMIKSLKGEF